MAVSSWTWPVMVLVVVWAASCQGHGRLVDPPSRASAWRYGFNTPTDYQDNEGFCGGFSHQYSVMGGKCGLCGDAWDETPRPHEAGGMYATGTIVRKYVEGQIIPVSVEITANHRGHFEFRICPNNNPAVEASQTCLNNHPLPLADGSGFYHYISSGNGFHNVSLRLPAGVTCTQCVFQWRYVAGNNWGICEDGTGQLGCGPQEEFRACADVAVSPSGATWTAGQSVTTQTQPPVTMKPTTTKLTTRRTTASPTTRRTTARPTTRRTSTKPSTTVSQGGSGGGTGSCHAVGVWQNIAGMDTWCETNCKHVPSYCPPSHCVCN